MNIQYLSDDDDDSQDEIEETLVNIQSMSIYALYSQFLHKDNIIELKPDYQRDLCWSQLKMNMFIDTIMKNYIVPNYVIYKIGKNEKSEYKNY